MHDANASEPLRRQPSLDDVCGRGLALVDALTGGRWGVAGREGIGKLVWAVCTTDGVLHLVPGLHPAERS